jgi:hypothetical protein
MAKKNRTALQDAHDEFAAFIGGSTLDQLTGDTPSYRLAKDLNAVQERIKLLPATEGEPEKDWFTDDPEYIALHGPKPRRAEHFRLASPPRRLRELGLSRPQRREPPRRGA